MMTKRGRFFAIAGRLAVVVSLTAAALWGNEPRFPSRVYENPATGVDVAAEDVDGDGHLDLIYTQYNGFAYTVLIRQGDGSGCFESVPSPLSMGSALNLSRMAVDDVDGDGDVDVAYSSGTHVNVAYNDGSGNFALSAPVDVGMGSSVREFGLADVDHDGDLDLLALSGNNSLSWITTSPTGLAILASTNLSSPPLGLGSKSGLVVADVDADGEVDVILRPLGGPDSLVTLFGDGTGGFGGPVVTPLPDHVLYIETAMINGDAHLDLVWGIGIAGIVHVMAGDGAGGFTEIQSFDNAGGGAFTIKDFNGDGATDLFTPDWYGHALYLGDGQGNFSLAQKIATGFFNSPVAADVDEDGAVDLIGVKQNGVCVLLTNGAHLPQSATIPYARTPENQVRALAAADVDGDGRDDLVVGNSLPYVALLRGTPGSLAPAVEIPFGAGATGLAIADINGDGLVDITTTDNGSAHTSVATAPGIYAPATLMYMLGGLGLVRAADIDADGNVDFVGQGGTGVVGVYLGDGVGGFLSTGGFYTGYSIRDVRVVDFNVDGFLDIAGTAGNSVVLLDGDGTRALTAPVNLLAGVNPTIVSFGDLNADGRPDFAVANPDAMGVSWRLNGATGLGPLSQATFSDTTEACAIEDLDQDGRDDLCVTVYGVGFAWLRGDGVGGMSAPTLFGADPRSNTGQALVIADLTADGKPDVALGTSTGTVSLSSNLGDGCSAGVAYGSGCAGSGTFVPTLGVSGCATPGDSIAVTIDDGLGGAVAILLFGVGQSSLPLPGGCSFLIQSLLSPGIALPLSAGGPGDGSIGLAATLPTTVTTPVSVVTQAFVIDPGVPAGFAATNAFRIDVVP